MIVCEESWEEVATDSAEIITKTSRFAWISSKPLDEWNLHERCNLGARYRWGIDSGILVEKGHGYQYEHAFSYNWNAMKGYHYLMRLGHMINVLAQYSDSFMRQHWIRNSLLDNYIISWYGPYYSHRCNFIS